MYEPYEEYVLLKEYEPFASPLSPFETYNIIETCPHNDLSDLSIDIMLKSFELGYDQLASNNCSILDDDTGSHSRLVIEQIMEVLCG
ncbi:hypothetical protein VN97_g5170 [Penicillium thymicola]|uniref:Uncharacterized protein n=1 Tax=Penicillium thymicola TaxID=293382 RepID=A0AAI9TJ50_PENTH|nr:hypothetical protein VN97_g5170 [Penicillium thymicola]